MQKANAALRDTYTIPKDGRKKLWMTYNELWQEWSNVPALAPHAKNLQERYTIQL